MSLPPRRVMQRAAMRMRIAPAIANTEAARGPLSFLRDPHFFARMPSDKSMNRTAPSLFVIYDFINADAFITQGGLETFSKTGFSGKIGLRGLLAVGSFSVPHHAQHRWRVRREHAQQYCSYLDGDFFFYTNERNEPIHVHCRKKPTRNASIGSTKTISVSMKPSPSICLQRTGEKYGK